ncbi:MAG: hypothetical protein ACKOEH_07350, partial [Actinomycetota bacterium]
STPTPGAKISRFLRIIGGEMAEVATGVAPPGRVHPLDPLSKSELESLIAALRDQGVIDQRHLIAMIQVEEPSKAKLARFRLGENVERAARVTC